jgi:hypothetical protein
VGFTCRFLFIGGCGHPPIKKTLAPVGMNQEDKSVIKTAIDALVTKRQIQQLAS